jgi:hypothetical protein
LSSSQLTRHLTLRSLQLLLRSQHPALSLKSSSGVTSVQHWHPHSQRHHRPGIIDTLAQRTVHDLAHLAHRQVRSDHHAYGHTGLHFDNIRTHAARPSG